MLKSFSILHLLLALISCDRSVEIKLPTSALVESPVPTPVTVTINQAITETIGSCSFTAPTDPTSILGVDYRLTFSEAIDSATFTTSDINNAGTGGTIALIWSLSNCGDDTNFKLTATSVVGDGTVIPTLAAGLVQTSGGENNLLSTATDNSVEVIRKWYQEAYIKAPNVGTTDYFGGKVSISGDTLAVAAYREDSNQNTITNGATASSDDSNSDSGAVYIYTRSGSQWSQQAYIKAANNDASDEFGNAVSISGNTLVVGASREDSIQTTITNGTTASGDNTNVTSGAVYVYTRSGVNWSQEAYIKAVNNDIGDEFGYSVSINDGRVAVGAVYERSNQTTITNGTTASGNDSIFSAGAVYVYKRSGVAWTQEAYIKASNSDTGDNFGFSVSLNGNTLAVGAKGEASNLTTITNGTTASADDSSSSSGAVYIYKRTGVNWAQEAYIKASNNDSFDNFGSSVSLSANTVAVGADFEASNQTTITNGTTSSSDDSNPNSGAVYVYKRTGVNWVQEAYVKASNSHANDKFGSSIALVGDTLVVGAYYEYSNQTTITNGTTSSSDVSAVGAGAVYVYSRTGSTWVQEAYLKASNAEMSDCFGGSVDFSGDTIVVGAALEDSNQTSITNGETASLDNSTSESGAVYVYRNRSRLFDVQELRTSVTSNSVTLSWDKSGGTSTGYFVAYQSGSTAPANCLSGTSLNAGDVDTFTELALSPSTTYSFRVCSTDGSAYSSGMITTVTTAP